MKHVIRNVSNRPVTIPCNTGDTKHIPPNYSMEFLNVEVINNMTVEKLKSRGLIRVSDEKERKPTSTASSSSSRKTKKANNTF